MLLPGSFSGIDQAHTGRGVAGMSAEEVEAEGWVVNRRPLRVSAPTRHQFIPVALTANQQTRRKSRLASKERL